MKEMKIPKKYVEIQKEKIKPTTYIQRRDTGELAGRLEKGDKRYKKYRYGEMGRTRVIRIVKPHKSFRKGLIIARTKSSYPRQKNSVLIRRNGRIGAIKVKKYKRRSIKGKKHKVKKYKRKRI